MGIWENLKKPLQAVIVLSLVISFLLAAALPAAATTEVWFDDFSDLSRVSSYTNVTIENGSVKLVSLPPFKRQGLQLGGAWSLDSPSIVQVGAAWYMYYAELLSPYGPSVALATSADANSWTPQGVVISAGFTGDGDAQGAGYEKVLRLGGTFHMWYSGLDNRSTYSVIHATSADGRSWVSHGVVLTSAMLAVGGHVVAPFVLWNGTGYTMWVSTNNVTTTWLWRLTSIDGDSWTNARLVMTPSESGNGNVGARWPFVLMTPTRFEMWYTCGDFARPSICKAHSGDGQDWIVEGVVLAADPSLPLESSAVGAPDVMTVAPGRYRMWYAGRGDHLQILSALEQTGFASSGAVESVRVSIPYGMVWQTLRVNKTEPVGTAVRIHVIDANTSLALDGFRDLASTSVSLASIDPVVVPKIQLRAVLTATSAATPTLLNWTVVFGTPPPRAADLGYLVVVALVAAAGIGFVGFTLLALRSTPRRR